MTKMTSSLTRLRRLRLLRWPLVGAALPLGSCQGVLDPQGPVASAERLLLINSTSIMLVVVVPVIVATLAFAWWYRSSNTRATRSLDESYEGRVEFVIWSIPALTVILLGGVIWIGSHQLDPRAPIPGNSDSLRVDVVALDPNSAQQVFRPALVAELKERPYEFDIQVQLCTSIYQMPIENVTVRWAESLSPFVTVAKLRLPQQDIGGDDNLERMDATSMSPWRVTEEHRSLGNIMRSRKEVYRLSSTLRHELNHQKRKEPENLAEVFGQGWRPCADPGQKHEPATG
jgi:hypothetical protein